MCFIWCLDFCMGCIPRVIRNCYRCFETKCYRLPPASVKDFHNMDKVLISILSIKLCNDMIRACLRHIRCPVRHVTSWVYTCIVTVLVSGRFAIIWGLFSSILGVVNSKFYPTLKIIYSWFVSIKANGEDKEKWLKGCPKYKKSANYTLMITKQERWIA